jgi:malonate-semialdehyde dehydrogenase (acetylating)/methylmalonate-semialdehyde dehydrogenase
MTERVLNYVAGQWQEPETAERIPVVNPATLELLGEVPLSGAPEVERAALAAQAAFPEWRRTPAVERVQYLFKLKLLLESNLEELARTITIENGKTLAESRGELRRAIENVEVACGVPTLMQGYNSEDVGRGIDETMIRQPIGVGAAICPFNFPAMIPFWFLPYAIACGNTYIVKPSEKVPLTMVRVFELLEQTGLPPGVVNLIHGASAAAEAILEHPFIRAISFVGSTPVAKRVYAEAARHGKRMQVQGGAKNPIVVLPDADVEQTTRTVAESAFGAAGQRCLAASLAVTVGEAGGFFVEAIAEAAAELAVGYGLEAGIEMGPVISSQSKLRIQGLIGQGEGEGARILVDGRDPQIPGYEGGHFVRPTVLSEVPREAEIFKTEIFGPVLGLIHVETVEEAIALVNSGQYGNMASLFTSSGAAARQFRHEAQVGNVGINVGVAAPMAFFPFSGWRDSFFGVVHGQGRDAVEFFTQQKVVVERWF